VRFDVLAELDWLGRGITKRILITRSDENNNRNN